MTRYLLAFVIWLSLSCVSIAAPNISGVSTSTLHHKQTGVVISGTGFGTKSTAAPFRYDNFESGGDVGDRILGFSSGGWDTSSSTSVYPQYSTTQTRRNDTRSARQLFEVYSTYNQFLGVWGSHIKNEEKKTAYISGWFWFSHGRSATSNPNQKLLNIGTEFDSGGYDAQNRVDVYRTSSGGSGHVYGLNCSGSVASQQYFENTAEVDVALGADGEWHRYETWVDLGTLNGNDAYRDFFVDLSQLEVYSGVTLLNNTDTECQYIDYILLGHYLRTETGDYGTRYWDEIYIDFTRHRVEIGNNSIWANCTHREIQIPTDWDDESVTITVNAGSFEDGEAYLFVVDGDNEPSAGEAIIFGEAETPTTISVGGGGRISFGGAN